MRPSQALDLHRARIRQIALSHHVQDIRVFGSALRGEDIEGSDLDLLVEPTSETTLFDIGAIRFELKQLLGLEIDVLTPNALPDKVRVRCCKKRNRYEPRRSVAGAKLPGTHRRSYSQHPGRSGDANRLASTQRLDINASA
jgi:uncharacterized protein